MNTILICLFIATLMPIMAKIPLAFAMNQAPGGYDNRHPREQQKTLTGFGARAMAAHANSFEALLMFTPGALAVIATNTLGDITQYCAIAFVLARGVYLFAYWYDFNLVRSIAWAVGFFVSLGMLAMAIF